MAREDDILLATTFDDDSDGDGVTDAQERRDGTDPGNAGDHLEIDPKFDPGAAQNPTMGLDPATMERNTVFDRGANLPAGQTIDSGLTGLTNVDGSAFKAGPNHFGIGDDALLQGHGDANSPLNVQRDPLATGDGATPQTPSSQFGTPAGGGHAADGTINPGFTTHVNMGDAPGGPTGTSNPNHDMSLVSAPKTASNPLGLRDGDKNPPKRDTSNDGAGTGKVDPKLGQFDAKDAGTEPQKGALDTVLEAPGKAYDSIKNWATGKTTNPDDDSGTATGPVNEHDLARAVAKHGANVHTVDGVPAGPQIEGGPPAGGGNPRNPLVTDPSPESASTTGTTSSTPTFHNPSSPDVVNPNDGLTPPAPGGGTQGGGGQDGRGSQSSAATAADSTSTDSQEIHAAGSDGSSGIHSTADTTDDTTSTTDMRSHASDITLENADDRPTIDPKLAPNAAEDPKQGLDPATMERNTVFNKDANLPAGQTIDSGLTGLTNVDGSAFKAGPNHFGIGDDALLQGHGDANSPVNMSRDPLAAQHTSGSGSHHPADGTINPGFTTHVNMGDAPGGPTGSANPTHDMSLVGQSTGGGRQLKDFDQGHAAKANPQSNDGGTTGGGAVKDFTGGAPKPTTFTEDVTNAVTAVVEAPGKLYDAVKEVVTTPAKGLDNLGAAGTKKTVNPDDTSGTATGPLSEEQVQQAMAHRGDVTHTVDGVAAGPQIEGAPPADNPMHSPLVTDPSPEGSSTLGTTSTTPTFHNPSSPDVVNPRDGLAPPAPGGTEGGTGQDGRMSHSDADTAAVASPDAPDAPTVSVVGSDGGPSTIQSVEGSDVTGLDHTSQALDSAGGDDDDLEELQVERSTDVPSHIQPAPVADAAPPIDTVDHGVQVFSDVIDGGDAVQIDDGGDAVQTFATGFLADSPDVVDHAAAIAPIEPMDHDSFVDQSLDDGGDPPPATDLFGNDDTLDG